MGRNIGDESESEDGSVNRKPSLRVYLAVLSVQMGAISLGCTLGWSGPALSDMARTDSRPHLTNDNNYDKNIKSWIGSSMTLGAMLGGVVCGFCIEYLGRKKTVILVGIPYSLGWLLLTFGNKVWILICGRIITGFSAGIILGTLPTYVAEISTPNIRGFLGMAFNFFVVFGFLYLDVLSLCLSWNYLSLASIAPSVLLSVSMFFMPESPSWLMSKYGRSLRVVEALHQLRHPDSDIEHELDELEERALMRTKDMSNGFTLKMILRQDVYKPTLIGISLLFFQQFSGMNALQFYLTDLFKDSGSLMAPEYATITVNAVMLLATICGSLVIDRFGRKILMISSGLGHCISIAVLGYYYYKNRIIRDEMTTSSTSTLPSIWSSSWSSTESSLITQMATHSESSIVPIICVAVFVSAFSIGYGPIPWVMLPEICNSTSTRVAMPISTVFNWIWLFIVTKEFEDLVQLVHNYGAYWIFSGLCALSVVFAIYLPETKGKSVEQIQRIYYPKMFRSHPSLTDVKS